MKHTIESVALGQDHTLALTSTGEVLTWGLNRFSQLGYVMEVSSGGKRDEPIQASPRKVGSLRKELVKGDAACKAASTCWTSTEVWTWGTNGGQLGRYHLSGYQYSVLIFNDTRVRQGVDARASAPS